MGEEFDYIQRKLGCRFLVKLAVHCENVEHMFVRSRLHFDQIPRAFYLGVFHTNAAERRSPLNTFDNLRWTEGPVQFFANVST